MLIHWGRGFLGLGKSACRGSNLDELQRTCGVTTIRLARVLKAQKLKRLNIYDFCHLKIEKEKVNYFGHSQIANVGIFCEKGEVQGVFGPGGR